MSDIGCALIYYTKSNSCRGEHYMPSEPNWIIIIVISGVFGYLIQYIFKLPSFVYRLRKRNDIRGKWYNYFYCEADSESPLHTALYTVKVGLLHDYKVKCVSDNMVYRGFGFIEHNHLCITLIYHDKLAKETVNLRFQLPNATHRVQLIGIWLSYDYNNHLSSGISILSNIHCAKTNFQH